MYSVNEGGRGKKRCSTEEVRPCGEDRMDPFDDRTTMTARDNGATVRRTLRANEEPEREENREEEDPDLQGRCCRALLGRTKDLRRTSRRRRWTVEPEPAMGPLTLWTLELPPRRLY